MRHLYALAAVLTGCSGNPLEAEISDQTTGGADTGNMSALLDTSAAHDQTTGARTLTGEPTGDSPGSGSASTSGFASSGPPTTSTTGASEGPGMTDAGATDSSGDPPEVLCAAIPLTIRDFRDAHPDFENLVGSDPGIVTEQLADDRTPVYASMGVTSTTTGADRFAQWYHDVDEVNFPLSSRLTLGQVAPGVFAVDIPEFFPADDMGWGNQGRLHNYHFTVALHSSFVYEGGETFEFTGDDDVWVFIDGHRVIDLGGVHPPMTATIALDDLAPSLGLLPGNTYDFDLFFAERHTVGSSFSVTTTIPCLGAVM